LHVEETCIFRDGASGAEFDAHRRPGLAQLLNAVRAQPHRFDVLLMMEGSRLGREAIETLDVLERIVASGMRVFHYLDDRDCTLTE